MAKPVDCNRNSDPLKLIRDGANQEQRLSPALNPVYVPVNEHGVAHGMIFAQALSQFLRYFDATNTANGNWAPFFSSDPSLRLAMTGVQNIEDYKTQIKSYFDFLNNLDNELKENELTNNLSYIFSCLASLAKQLDVLKEGLPSELPLKSTLQNLIQSQLATAFNRLISYQKAGVSIAVVADVAPITSIKILGVLPEKYQTVLDSGFSKDWITSGAPDWNSYVAGISADSTVYGNPAGSIFDLTNHIATHNLFTSIAHQFLKVFARVINEALQALEFTFTNWDRHDPHYTLFLSFLRLMEYARTEANTITARHLDFYYREVLQLKEKPALPAKAHLIVELAKQAASHQIKEGEFFKAGKDDKGIEAFFSNKRDLIANQAKVTSLQTLYRHGSEDVGTDLNSKKQTGRLYASPAADSDDGLGAELTSADQSWHPFFNKIYSNGKLQDVKMPAAEVGFAIVSHYLWLAEGRRDITINFTVNGFEGNTGEEKAENFVCLFTGEKGWIEKSPSGFVATTGNNLRLTVSLSGDDSAIIAYDQKKHGYNFDSISPVLIVKMRNVADKVYLYSQFENTVLKQIELQLTVDQVKNLTLSNDFGSIDAAKPFLPFGAIPESGSSMIIGSNEIFTKKNITNCNLNIRWKNIPDIKSVAYLAWEQYYPSATYDYYTKFVPWANVTFLKEGQWSDISYQTLFDGDNEVSINIKPPPGEFNKNDQPDFQTDAQFNIKTKTGFARLTLPFGMGHKTYRSALSDYILAVAQGFTATKPTEPYTPEIKSITVDYTAVQIIDFGTAQPLAFENRSARLLHISPFGFAEQHAFLKLDAPDSTIFLFPQFRHLNISDNLLPEGQAVLHESEFFIGVTGLKPPQNLSLLFQVADGTADPLSKKPPQHINWSYLRNNEWIEFFLNEVEDQTDGLLKSGLITFAFPRDASENNSLFAPGQHWIRAAVSTGSDAVCKLIIVAAQGLLAEFTNQENDPSFASKVLPSGTISKLNVPVAEVKKISQPFDSFGGRGAEVATGFYTRISERLRHKDRAVTLWDYERLVLEAFPEIYRAKCLNHTQYEPNDSGTGIYRELAPGHVTVVTIPNKQFHNLCNPLRPFTSLGMMQDIYAFIAKRVSCFVKLHVRNPQFEEVRVHMKVRFYNGFDETFYTNLLQESIMHFLSPWAFPEGGNPSFGGKIYKSVLIDFVEEQAYVDYVTDVQLFHDLPDKKGTSDKNEIEGSLAVSILVSVPAIKHQIIVINPSEEIVSSEKCNCES
jgi:hypothetical protein